MDSDNAELLSGLLLDGIRAAEHRKEEILTRLVNSASSTEDGVTLRRLLGMLQAWMRRDSDSLSIVRSVFNDAVSNARRANGMLRLILTGLSIDIDPASAIDLRDRVPDTDKKTASLLTLCGPPTDRRVAARPLAAEMSAFRALLKTWAVEAPATNFIAAAGLTFLSLFELEVEARATFESLMYALASRPDTLGPFEFLVGNCIAMTNNLPAAYIDRSGSRNLDAVTGILGHVGISHHRTRYPYLIGSEHGLVGRVNEELETRALQEFIDKLASAPAQVVFSNMEVTRLLLDGLTETFALSPRQQWWHALQRRCVQTALWRSVLHATTVESVVRALQNGTASSGDQFAAASYLIVDLVGASHEEQRELRKAARTVDGLEGRDDIPALRAARLIRRLPQLSLEDGVDRLKELTARPDFKRLLFEECGWTLRDEETGQKSRRKRGR